MGLLKDDGTTKGYRDYILKYDGTTKLQFTRFLSMFMAYGLDLWDQFKNVRPSVGWRWQYKNNVFRALRIRIRHSILTYFHVMGQKIFLLTKLNFFKKIADWTESGCRLPIIAEGWNIWNLGLSDQKSKSYKVKKLVFLPEVWGVLRRYYYTYMPPADPSPSAVPRS